MIWAAWVVAGLLGLGGAWMTYDGARALLAGDYTTPSSGKYAGQLGPWAGLVERVGIPARSSFMKVTFVVLGLLALAGAAMIALGMPGARFVALFAAILSLWYLPAGTVVGIINVMLISAFWNRFP